MIVQGPSHPVGTMSQLSPFISFEGFPNLITWRMTDKFPPCSLLLSLIRNTLKTIVETPHPIIYEDDWLMLPGVLPLKRRTDLITKYDFSDN